MRRASRRFLEADLSARQEPNPGLSVSWQNWGGFMQTRDHEFHRHIGYALAFPAPSPLSKSVALLGRFSVLASLIAVLGKSISIALGLF
jgi:hypothetical protein